MNLVLKADFIINYLLGTSTGTANQANIGVEAIKNMVVPLPPINEQRRIVEKVNHLIELCNSLEQQIKDSTNTQSLIFDAVLAKLEVIT